MTEPNALDALRLVSSKSGQLSNNDSDLQQVLHCLTTCLSSDVQLTNHTAGAIADAAICPVMIPSGYGAASGDPSTPAQGRLLEPQG